MLPDVASGDSRHACITGLGFVGPAGSGIDALWEAACDARVEPVRTELPDLPGPDWANERLTQVVDPQALLSYQAGLEAWSNSGIGAAAPTRTAIVAGSVYQGFAAAFRQAELLAEKGDPAVSSHLPLHVMGEVPVSLLAHDLGIRGVGKMTTGTCSTGIYVLMDALDLIRVGRADVVLAVAGQTPLHPVLAAGYRNLRVVSHSGFVRPFDIRRDGFVAAPGAGAMIIESRSHARARGANVLAELRGGGNTTDGTLSPSASGPAPRECIENAFVDANCDPSDIELIIPHASGTRTNDAFEAELLSEVFAGRVPPVTGAKRVLGHTFAAAGMHSALLATLCIERMTLPPIAVDHQRDPRCELPLVTEAPRAWSPGAVLISSYGLGGNNSALIVSPWSDSDPGRSL